MEKRGETERNFIICKKRRAITTIAIPISGGKDSTFQLHILKNVYGMNPLAVTFNHNWLTKVGYYNLMNCLEIFNVDHMMFNRDLVNRIARRSIDVISDACWHCHSGIGSFALHIAQRVQN